MRATLHPIVGSRTPDGGGGAMRTHVVRHVALQAPSQEVVVVAAQPQSLVLVAAAAVVAVEVGVGVGVPLPRLVLVVVMVVLHHAQLQCQLSPRQLLQWQLQSPLALVREPCDVVDAITLLVQCCASIPDVASVRSKSPGAAPLGPT